jgi:fibronectin-binding autotransporter adhesin
VGNLDTDYGIMTGVLSNGSLTVNDSTHTGVLELTNTETYTGGTTIANGTLALSGTAAALYANGTVTNNGDFDISQSTNQTIGDLNGTATTSTVFLGAFELTTGGDNASTTYAGVIQDGGLGGGVAGSLIKVGTGVFTLTGANTYTGGTTITGGTLALAGAGSLDAATSVTNNSIFDISQAADQTIGDLNGTSTTAETYLGGNSLTLGGDDASTTYAGHIADGGLGGGTGGVVIKEGTGVFTLTNSNSYTGGP